MHQCNSCEVLFFCIHAASLLLEHILTIIRGTGAGGTVDAHAFVHTPAALYVEIQKLICHLGSRLTGLKLGSATSIYLFLSTPFLVFSTLSHTFPMPYLSHLSILLHPLSYFLSCILLFPNLHYLVFSVFSYMLFLTLYSAFSHFLTLTQYSSSSLLSSLPFSTQSTSMSSLLPSNPTSLPSPMSSLLDPSSPCLSSPVSSLSSHSPTSHSSSISSLRHPIPSSPHLSSVTDLINVLFDDPFLDTGFPHLSCSTDLVISGKGRG